MTCSEFISFIKSRGATLAPPATPNKITLTNTSLQQRRRAMLPAFISELYTQTGGINLGNGYIFGPDKIPQGLHFPVPSILQINDELTNIPQTIGKTIFGRNDLFWFCFDAFGVCYMLDNLTLKPLRRYDDPYRALSDCLIAGKF
ncbi:MAG: hypothetical protein IJ517_01285 [Alphaproteobacteria bacterium]|nr:hypothetical protein [Alphaproteobacteria bacterium]